MIILQGRTKRTVTEAAEGKTLLQLALKAKAEWGSSCQRGTCARCRCLIVDGMEHLEPVTDAEWDRLEPEELEQGYRLSCQAVIRSDHANVEVKHKPYF
ncbi:(2Fe-2S)-binding protein [Paenibacillus pasadenensis]|uniref:2Fe-2S iron-sulfur cluster-binding protein n=1 Tax=Paenibacillus pasadenensis TaxID=217090 RepID=UPI00203E0F7A|nr:2Fe-2S iron-sulfur cluster-binding protein [Paenibacillus pasadenensis]MCM3747391.1 (2Fe-2S)-binding protein [Paenibacillus pasadenensis]